MHVTRRVYRSGEGEYLINRQPCRLRDIRELLAGTGITTEAYCIIEQGKVDALLQSSPRDRRVIFEEAAGISQFKAKKATAARRLERVEQNLLRLSDIVDEVESRLRSVRSQAGKARRYRECTERLQQLRTEVAPGRLAAAHQADRLPAKRSSAELETPDRRARGRSWSATMPKRRNSSAGSKRAPSRCARSRIEASTTREQIAALQATVENQQTRRLDLQQEIARIREQLAAMSTSERQRRRAIPRRGAPICRLPKPSWRPSSSNARNRSHMPIDRGRELDDALSEHEPLRMQLAECVRTATLLDEQIAVARIAAYVDADAKFDQCSQAT